MNAGSSYRGEHVISNLAAVVVHHRSYETVGETVHALLRQGVSPQNLIVVDNSEEPGRREELHGSLPGGVEVLFRENRGYGAAVNAGIDFFANRQGTPEFLLVATHETRPDAGAVGMLVEALQSDPDAAVAGPTLVSGEGVGFVWSAGGYLAPLTHIPSHYLHRAGCEGLSGKVEPESREWLDGAFLVYRWEEIESFRISEEFFLYMEETDLHMRFRKAGRKVLWVPRSKVWQDSGGIPPYYLARNLRLLFLKHEGFFRRLAVVPYAVVRRVAADVVRRRNFSTIIPSLRGLVTKLATGEDTEPVSSIALINPLGAALSHYSTEIESVLVDSDIRITPITFLEPSASGKPAILWIFNYALAIINARLSVNKSGSRLLILWPVLGYWDIVLLRILGISRAALVMHDPHPLVKAVGYSRLAKECASLVRGNIELIAHSQRALSVMQEEVPRMSLTLVPHPILRPEFAQQDGPVRPLVRVFGQYKPDRDLPSLAALGRALNGSAVLEVYGRGWPNIDGWRVFPGFLKEERMTELMSGSSVILIPYKNFFQSGIAIRALELGVPFVGPKASVLADMMGPYSPLLVDEGGTHLWIDAVAHAVQNGKKEAREAAIRWRDASVAAWSGWVATKDF